MSTVLDVYTSSASRLQQVPGVGATTATQLVAAARQVATAVRDGLRIRVDLNPADAASTALITALHQLREFESVADSVHEPARRLTGELNRMLPIAASTGSRLRRFFSGRQRQAEAQTALASVQQLVESADSTGLVRTLNAAGAALHHRCDPADAWREFERRSPEFYGLLGEIVVAGPAVFRRAVAPVHLRRNQDDVLAELPDLVRADDWLEFGRADYQAYREAVAAGNFMAMRRAAFTPGTPATSAKLTRLLEIIEESAANGRKVVVFTNFRDVLATVGQALDGRTFGPIAGDVPAARRQSMIDRFAEVDGHAVLLAQIQAGGTGLDIQAANVAVICEPQVKPSLEEQAIARLQRMGQTRSVQAHRLLVADSVDQRMVEMLAAKSRLFDEYARRSEMAETSPEAVDISEVELARRIVADEQQRIARESIARQADQPC